MKAEQCARIITGKVGFIGITGIRIGIRIGIGIGIGIEIEKLGCFFWGGQVGG